MSEETEGQRVDRWIRSHLNPGLTTQPEPDAETKAAGDWLRRAAGIEPEPEEGERG
jgi:hypothetical protein